MADNQMPPPGSSLSDGGGGRPCTLRWVRRVAVQAPFALPLLAVSGVLESSPWGSLCVALAIALAWCVSRWRLFACTLLCSMLAFSHQSWLKSQAEALQGVLDRQGHVVMEGTVERSLSHGFILKESSGGVSVALRGNSSLPGVGDKVRVTAIGSPSHPSPVKGMFDREIWEQGQGVAASLDYVDIAKLGAPFSWELVKGVAGRAREGLASRLMPPGTEGDVRRQVLCALVLGEKTRAERETMDIFRNGGCLHAFAVSGLHVGLIACILGAVFSFFRIRPGLWRLLLVGVTGVHVLVTGLAVPALRAYLMLALMLGGIQWKRRANPLNLWCFAALFILLLWPWQWNNAGFRLSFAVYGAIALAVEYGREAKVWFGPDSYLPRRLYSRWDCMLRHADYALRGVALVSLAAWLISLPLAMESFHALNIYGFLTNMAIAPVLPVVMSLGLVSLGVGWVPVLASFADWLSVQASGVLVAIVGFFASWPGAYLPAEPPQPRDSGMVLHIGYDRSICLLGNPGLLIDTGNRETARFRTVPALFHAGFSPAALVVTRPSASFGGGAPLVQGCWPRLHKLAAMPGRGTFSFRTAAGQYTVYAAPLSSPRKPEACQAPIIRWEYCGKVALYVGDASMLTYETLPREARRADMVILGHNGGYPVDASLLAEESGARQMVMLPSASAQDDAIVPAIGPNVHWVRESAPVFRFP